MTKQQATPLTSFVGPFFKIAKCLLIAIAGASAILILFLILVFNLGTNTPRSVPSQTAALTVPTKAERIAQVSRILQRKIVLPSAILDAHFDEVVVGGVDEGIFSGMGPVDYVLFMHLQVAPADIEKWTALLDRPLEHNASLNNPEAEYPWWVDAKRFPKIELFEPHPLSSRQGWVGISRETGEIWVYGFTT